MLFIQYKDKIYTQIGKVFRLPWELNVCTACRPSIHQHWLRHGTVSVRQGSVRFNLTEDDSATCLFQTCYIIYLWFRTSTWHSNRFSIISSELHIFNIYFMIVMKHTKYKRPKLKCCYRNRLYSSCSFIKLSCTKGEVLTKVPLKTQKISTRFSSLKQKQFCENIRLLKVNFDVSA